MPSRPAASLTAPARTCSQFAEAVQAFRGWGKLLRSGRRRTGTTASRPTTGLPGRQVPAAQRLVAPRPAPARAPESARPPAVRWVRREAPGRDGVNERASSPHGYGRPAPAGDPRRDRRRAEGGLPAEVVTLIREHDLPRECTPDRAPERAEVWEALLDKMPLTALVAEPGEDDARRPARAVSAAAKQSSRTRWRDAGVHPQVAAAPDGRSCSREDVRGGRG